MRLNAKNLALLPAFIMFLLTCYLGGLTMYVDIEDLGLKSQIWNYSFIALLTAINLTVAWLAYWALLKRIAKSH